MSVKFNNKNRVKPIGLLLSFLLMLAVAGLASYYLWFNHLNKTIEASLWMYFVFISTFFYFGGFCYVEVEISSKTFDVKYYNLFPFWRQYKRILLPLDKVKHIKVRSGLCFVGSGILISGRIKGRLATYPTVGLSACTAKQRKQLKQFALELKENRN